MSKHRTDEIALNPDVSSRVETIFIVDNLFVMQNGINQSIVRKMKFMEDAWGYKPLLLVAEYNADLNRIHNMLEYADFTGDQVHLNRGSRIAGVYDYFQKSYPDDLPVTEYARMDDGGTDSKGFTYKRLSPDIDMVYAGETLARMEYYTGFQSRLRLVERFEQGKKTKSVFYDDCGCVSLIRIHDPDNPERWSYDYYYTTDRKLRVKTEYRYDDAIQPPFPKNKVVKLSVFDDAGNVIRECADNAGLMALYLEETLRDPEKIYLVVDESGTYLSAVASVSQPNAARISVVHSAFLLDANNLKSDPQPFYKDLCAQRERFDGVVFLTELTRRDFLKKYADVNRWNTFVIPHPYPHSIVPTAFEDRDHRKAVIVSRFDPVKRLDYAIDIFKLVTDQLPDVTLEIYGFGQETDKYIEQIKKLGLEDKVLLKGFAGDPASVFRGAAFSMMTSHVEGYGITLIESLCNGCPAFAFDIKYGPSDIIRDGQTGYLIPYQDNAAFAEKIVAYFEDEDLQRAFSENAYADAPRFSQETFLQNWGFFMETMVQRRLRALSGAAE
jgi:poly(glycerol-phosphate) alpha-glucosyltransferase